VNFFVSSVYLRFTSSLNLVLCSDGSPKCLDIASSTYLNVGTLLLSICELSELRYLRYLVVAQRRAGPLSNKIVARRFEMLFLPYADR
jgi:hypothetical protein